MARPIVLGNGEMHVGINDFGLVHDLYFPYVGLENHTIGRGLRHRIGVWIDGELSWLDDGNWHLEFSYPHTSLVGHTIAKNDTLGVMLEFDDAVDSELSVFMRTIHVINRLDYERQIRVFMHQAFVIGDSRGNTDTAQYLPDTQAVMHYRGRRVFVVSGLSDDKAFDQYTVGLFGIEGHEGSWRDADDGELSGCNVEHGRVDSVIRFTLEVAAHSSGRIQYWVAAGTSLRSALDAHKIVRDQGVAKRLHATAKWWQNWLKPAMSAASHQHMPSRYREQFLRSAMILKSHFDKRGAIIASTDSAKLNYDRDAYAYCWPRDGAYVVWPLIRLGYQQEPLAFFDFCRKVLHPRGYLSHKYRADGALGSSWHPYVHGSRTAPPIQTDETALVCFMFVQYYQQNPSEKLIAEYYESFVRPMAAFLASYIDAQTMLPQPSYDLWEENYMVSTYTTAVTHAALLAAAELAEVAHDADSAVSWRTAAEDMYQAAHRGLYSDERQCLRKGFKWQDDHLEPDDTIDMSAIFGAFMFGLYDAESREVTSSMETALKRFDQSTHIGLPRYENDSYRRSQGELMSNIWLITTLWHAQYALERGDTQAADTILEWVLAHTYGSGAMAEQIVPSNGYSTSVAPLIWSHAEYMATLLDYMAATEEQSHGKS